MHKTKPINSECLQPAAGFRKKQRLIATISLVACVLLLSISILQAPSGVARAGGTVPFQKAFLEHGENAFDFGTQNGLKTRDYEANKTRYGFTIADTWKPKYMEGSDIDDSWFDVYSVSGSSKHDFAIYIQQVLLQDTRDRNLYAFAYRVVMSPNDSTERHGFLNLFTRGTQWINRRQTTSVQLRKGRNLSDWAPKNKPNNSSGSFGLGFDKNGPSIGASIDWNHSELRINSRSNTGRNYYETEYDYDRGGWDWFWGVASNYMKNDVVSYGFFTFYTTSIALVEIVHRGEFESINGITRWEKSFSGSY